MGDRLEGALVATAPILRLLCVDATKSLHGPLRTGMLLFSERPILLPESSYSPTTPSALWSHGDSGPQPLRAS